MTNREKLEAIERKERMYLSARGRCHFCGKRLAFSDSQSAHRIPKHKKYIKKYGANIIHHELNMLITCDLCNNRALLDPATHPIEAQDLIKQIKEIL